MRFSPTMPRQHSNPVYGAGRGRPHSGGVAATCGAVIAAVRRRRGRCATRNAGRRGTPYDGRRCLQALPLNRGRPIRAPDLRTVKRARLDRAHPVQDSPVASPSTLFRATPSHEAPCC